MSLGDPELTAFIAFGGAAVTLLTLALLTDDPLLGRVPALGGV
jgi:hypothetical protein